MKEGKEKMKDAKKDKGKKYGKKADEWEIMEIIRKRKGKKRRERKKKTGIIDY